MALCSTRQPLTLSSNNMKKLQGEIENLSTMRVGRSYRNGDIYEHLFTCSGVKVEFSLLSKARLNTFNFKNGDYCILLGEYKSKNEFNASIVAPLGGGTTLRGFKVKVLICLLFSVLFVLLATASFIFESASPEKHLHIAPFMLLAFMFYWLYKYYKVFVRLLSNA
jgi:hypothetical protein